VRRVLEGVPSGTVLTYGEVALESGHPGAARAVGTYLARGASGLPWWRVVTSTGRLVPGSERRHAQLLRAEGVRVVDNRVVMPSRMPRGPVASAPAVPAGRRAGFGGSRPADRPVR
jgi:methylated-DNA-protein-cysteine methyltransferase-like protein